jgi:hypothetical protein
LRPQQWPIGTARISSDAWQGALAPLDAVRIEQPDQSRVLGAQGGKFFRIGQACLPRHCLQLAPLSITIAAGDHGSSDRLIVGQMDDVRYYSILLTSKAHHPANPCPRPP